MGYSDLTEELASIFGSLTVLALKPDFFVPNQVIILAFVLKNEEFHCLWSLLAFF